MNRLSARLAVPVAALVALGICVTPAAAKIVHHEEGSFNGADTPGGQFGLILSGDAVDNSGGPSAGDVYVAESNFSGLGRGVVDKFDPTGAYAGVEINGSGTPQGSFAFSLGSGVAVDSSAGADKGDLYVADTEHGVVDRFSEAGTFECQITGKDPLSQSAEEIAHECNGAVGSATPDGSIVPAGLAVDSSGHIFVADDAHAVIDEFGPSGEYIEQIADSHLTTEIGPIALDSAGNLYVVTANPFFNEENAHVVKFHNGSFSSVLDDNTSAGVGVDPATNHVYVGDVRETQGEIAEYEPSGALLDTFASGSGEFSGLAVNGTTGNIYAAELINFSSASVKVFGPDIVVPDVSTGPATGVTETSATLNGHLDPDAAHGGGEVTECRFEYGPTTGYGETAPCSPPPPYSSAQDVSAAITGLTPSSTYHFRLEAANANGSNGGEDETFTTPGPPAIDSETPHAKARGATLLAQINPFGYDTTCQLQYVDEEGFDSSGYANATTLPCSPEDLGEGFGDQSASVTLSGLRLGTTYHFHFIATNQAEAVTGADETFTTFGIDSFSLEALDEEGEPETQAGAHPYVLRTAFVLSKQPGGSTGTGAVANLQTAQVQLPPGLVGDSTATPKCTRGDLGLAHCSGAAQVGVIRLETSGGNLESGLYNLAPPHGIAAEFGAVFNSGVHTYIDAKTRTGGDYGVTAEAPNNTSALGVYGISTDFWGVPAAESHDPERRCPVPGKNDEQGPCSANEPPRPFLSNPTSCSGPLTATLSVDAWQAPGEFVEASSEIPATTGCNQVEFDPTIEARPTTNVADSPSGLHVDLHIPQNEACDPGPPVSCGLAVANLKDTLVALPKGITVNPAAASGLDACSSAQLALHSAEPADCPDAAKIGSVEVDTPLLDHPLPGAVYIAKPHDNPFNSLLAIYIAVNDPESGVVVKLAGHVEANPETGQLTTTFEENPQLPFEDFKLDFFKGAHATLRTPATCGTFKTTTSLTPWSAPESGPPATPSDPWAISAAPGGGKCSAAANEEPNAPNFEAGTETPDAGAYSPFVLRLARADGSQELKGIDTVLPPGLVGKLAGVAECPEATIEAVKGEAGAQEQASPSCPPGSQVGVVNVGAGAGPAPYYVQGNVYLAGPYKGAPLSLAIITPAVAGPFDLGTVVVRAALYVNPETAQITAKSDPLPTILQGIPLDVRSIALSMSRPQFTLNPTNCEKKQVTASALSVLGQSAALSSPFQVGGCKSLGFKPKLKISLKGGTKRTKHPALTATVTYPKGSYANIASAQVTLPHSEFLDQSHIGTVCTRVQFAEGAVAGEKCPAGSIYGHARAITPLLDKPLEGPVYLRSSSHNLPDLVAALNGQISVALAGRVDTGKGGGIRNTFELVPDAPVSKFTLEMQGGKKGLLVNSENICSKPQKALAHFVAQNGKVDNFSPLIANSCKGKAKKKGKGHKGHGKH